jgi:hypothetical protein
LSLALVAQTTGEGSKDFFNAQTSGLDARANSLKSDVIRTMELT